MIEDFISKIKENLSTQNVDAYQIDYAKTSDYSISVFEQKVHSSSIKDIENITIKVKIGKKIGLYHTECLQDDNVDNIIKNAIENANAIELEEENFFHDGRSIYQDVEPYKPNMQKLNSLDIIDFLIRLEQAAYTLDKRINKVISTTYRQSESHYIKENSLGLSLSHKSQSAYSNIYLSAKENTDIKTGYANTTFIEDKDFDITSIAKKAVERAVDRLGGSKIASKKYNTVFNNSSFANLLPILMSPFYATAIEEKYSKFEDKIGQKIASDIVTLVDSPHLKGGYDTISFDSEGVATKNKNLIECGNLKTILHNLRTAHKAGVQTTANANSVGGIRLFNAYIKPLSSSKEDVIKQANNGIYVTSVSGLNSGYNQKTGDLSFAAEGFMITDGKVDKPLSQFVINTNLYDLFLNIEAIGNDLEFEGSQFGSPTIFIKDISVSSK